MASLFFLRVRVIMAVLATLLLATACGGGAGDLLASGVGSGGTGSVAGSVTAGPVGNASVSAYAITGGQMGARIGTATTDASGNFSMSIGSYSGAVMLQVGGGSYMDEATGTVMPMAPGDVMTTVIPSVTAGATYSGIQITPVTAMAQAMAQHMTGGMTDANIVAANAALGNNFSVSDILHVQPMNPLVTGSGSGASQDAKNYGMTLAAMSKYAQTLGLSTSSTVITAMMNDASDGIMDGKASGVAVQMDGMGGGMMMPATAGTSGMGAAMTAFMNSAQNRSGVMTTDLANKLNGASGPMGGGASPKMNATVSGTVFNGTVSNAMVMAFAISGGVVGAQIGGVATDSQGNFTLSMGSYSGAVMLKASGVTYMDPASRTVMTMAANEFMSAVLPTVASGANVTGLWMTPVTSMAQSRASGMSGGMTDANIAAANMAMGNYFSAGDILHTAPMNPNATASGASASQDARNYGMSLAAMSQYAQSLNMPISSTLISAMMNDAADGVLDGRMNGSQISMVMGGMMGTSSLLTAMTNFMNSPANVSGLTTADMTTFMQKLIASNGSI